MIENITFATFTKEYDIGEHKGIGIKTHDELVYNIKSKSIALRCGIAYKMKRITSQHKIGVIE